MSDDPDDGETPPAPDNGDEDSPDPGTDGSPGDEGAPGPDGGDAGADPEDLVDEWEGIEDPGSDAGPADDEGVFGVVESERIDEAVDSVPGGTATAGLTLLAVVLAWMTLVPVSVLVPDIGLIFLETGTLFMLYAMVLLGLNLQFGDTGIVNFGPVLFFAVGGYGMALMTAQDPFYGTGLGLPWVIGLAVGIVLALVFGAVVGVTSIRLREDYLAVTTLAAAEIFVRVVGAFEDPFGGEKGLTAVPSFGDWFVVDTVTQRVGIFLLFFAILLICYEGFRRLSKSPYGRVLRAIQSDEDAARSIGKPTFRYKMAAFVYGAAVAGLAGVLLALFTGSVSPGFFSIDVTVILWIGMMIGGIGNHRGAIAGLAIIMGWELALRFLNEFATTQVGLSGQDFDALRLLMIGVLLVVVIRFRPAGLWGEEERLEVFG